MSTWTVVAPGHSSKFVRPEHLTEDGPIVVINNAAAAPIPRDIWSAIDKPNNFAGIWHPVAKEERSGLGLIWCRQNWEPLWAKLGFRVWGATTKKDDFHPQFLRRDPDETDVNLGSLTILWTITRCVSYRADKIVVYGADMQQQGYGVGPEMNTALKEAQWENRWASEAKAFKKACVLWEEAGTIVERRTLDE